MSKLNPYSNIEFVSQLNKYIPSLVMQNLLAENRESASRQNARLDIGHGQQAPKKKPFPTLQPMETVVVFADISGFTNLSEACAKKGVRGNEELAFAINRYIEGMVKNLNKYGGDIIKFVGDALIVMWPASGEDAGLSRSMLDNKEGIPLPEMIKKETIRKAI